MFAAIALILLTTSIAAMTNISVKAQDDDFPHGGTPGVSRFEKSPPAGITPSVTVTVDPYLSFRPNPIGIGQSLLVNFWNTPPPAANRYLSYYTVTITKPGGDQDIFGPYNSYVADGTAWFEYVPDQVGTYKLKFEFGGTYFPAGVYISGVLNGTGEAVGFNAAPSTYPSTWFKPASTAEQELVVQSEMVSSWPASPLPTDYWTRPISPENREWYTIAGNYPYAYVNDARDWFGPFVTAPNTSHVAWKRQGAIGGLIGGETGQYSLTPSVGNPGVIYAGRGYQTYDKPGVGSVAACYDIRTGQVYYEIPVSQGGTTPYIISYVEGTPSVLGGIPSLTPELIAADRTGLYGRITLGTRLIKVNPWTGQINLNVTGMTGYFYNNELVLSVQDLGAAAGANRYRLINWTTVGTSTNFTTRILSNTSFPIAALPSLVDYERAIAVQVNRFGAGAVYGGNIFAINLKTGAIMWNITTDPQTPFSSGCASIDEGKVAVVFEDRSWRAYDLFSGTLAWRSEVLDYPWGVFWSYDASSWNGVLYAGAYTGVYALDWEDGHTLWRFDAPSVPFETPYANEYSFHSATIVADGKLYTYGSEHTPSQPLTRGWKFYCLNATTGEKIWELAGSGIDSRRYQGSVADGYLTIDDRYFGTMFVIGKGKSATTVEASPEAIAKGSQVLVKGTVLDMSPGQPGTPCVSKESMTTQMEYIHMQAPIDGIWHNITIEGVPINLSAIGSEGTVVEIGTVTTNGYYGTFSQAWTPPTEETYTIIASFAGDDSYGSSSAASAVAVGPALETPNQPEPPTPADNTPILYGIAAAAIAIIIAVAVATILILRKHP
jgi:outer membrane protein assembly factor BamB